MGRFSAAELDGFFLPLPKVIPHDEERILRKAFQEARIGSIIRAIVDDDQLIAFVHCSHDKGDVPFQFRSLIESRKKDANGRG